MPTPTTIDQSISLAELRSYKNQLYADGNSWFCIKIPKRFYPLIKSLNIQPENDFVVTIVGNNITAIHSIEQINKLISFFHRSFKQTPIKFN